MIDATHLKAHRTAFGMGLRKRGVANRMLAERGCDADWFREGLQERSTEPCIHRAGAAKTSSHTTPGFIAAATGLRTCSDG